MATHSSILAWESLRTEEPGSLQSIRLQRVGHDLVAECAHVHTHTHTDTHTHTHGILPRTSHSVSFPRPCLQKRCSLWSQNCVDSE